MSVCSRLQEREVGGCTCTVRALRAGVEGNRIALPETSHPHNAYGLYSLPEHESMYPKCLGLVYACPRMVAVKSPDVSTVGVHAGLQPGSIQCHAHEQGHACMWQVCRRFMRRCPQVVGKEDSMSADDADEAASYGSGHFSEDHVENFPIPIPVGGGEDLATLLSGIAALARGQGIMMEKMSFLENIVGTVQFDMTFVRDDMAGVHEAMERFGDFVGDVQDAVVEVDRLKEQGSLEGSAGQTRKGKEAVQDLTPPPRAVLNLTLPHRAVLGFTQPPSESISQGERGEGVEEHGDLEDWFAEGGNYSEDVHALMAFHDVHSNRLATTVSGRGELGHHRDVALVLGSPQCQQTRVSMEREPMEEDSQLIEYSCQSTQPPKNATMPRMWSEFETAVKDWRPPSKDVTETEEGWVSAKKGRWDTTEYAKEHAGTTSAQLVEVRGTLNLNLLPEKSVPEASTWGGMDVAASKGTTVARKNAGNTAWRGTASGRRPPAVQPRFHATVSIANDNSL